MQLTLASETEWFVSTDSGRCYRVPIRDITQLIAIAKAERNVPLPPVDFTALPKLILAEWERLGPGAGLVRKYDANGKLSLSNYTLE